MTRLRWGAAALALGLTAAPAGPYDIPLRPTALAPAAQGHARLVSSSSPFGIAVTADGRASYDVEVTVSGLPAPAGLGRYVAYVAWGVSPDLSQWFPLGAIQNGTTTVGPVDLNKFLLVITAEAAPEPAQHAGPVVMRGYSPSTWLQSFIQHPLFRGVY